MNIEKVLEMLGVEKLDESKQTDIKDTLSTIIETRAGEIAKGKVDEQLVVEKERLVEEFEKKFDAYKEDVTSKFSNFVDSILEEEMVIPEKIVRYARLGELYEDLIDQFKVRLAIDEGLLDKEVKGILKEAKEEIVDLRKQVNSLTGEKLELEKDARDLATNIYLRKKCDGLTEAQKTAVMGILEGASKADIDKKFDVIVESISVEKKEVVVEEKKVEEGVVEPVVEESKGVVEPKTEPLTESTPSMMDVWKKMLRENKF